MPRTHPPTLLTIARRTITEERLFARGDVVLVAVSGGADSMALMHVLARLRAVLGHALVAHGVDHGLRAEASAELDVAASFARDLDVPFARTRVDVAPGGNVQARARTARYEALGTAAARASASCVATAHHATDRAETVLLRLLRGAGPRGLAVLPPRARFPCACASASACACAFLVRPFLRAPRSAVEAHVARHAIPFSLDPSNRDPRFLRARVRHELLPLLRVLSPKIDDHLCALADQLQGVIPMDDPALARFARAPRQARQALEALVRTRSPRARVALGAGRVARWDTAAGAVEIAAEPVRPRRETRPSTRK
jgi:tRNA(Ile)-lysidine synthase